MNLPIAILTTILAQQPTTPNSWNVPDYYVIDLKDDISNKDKENLLGGLEFYPSGLEAETKEEIVKIPGDSSILDQFRNNPLVEGVQPLALMQAFDLTPNDPKYAEQWGMKSSGAEKAWSYSTGRGVTVAVVDTGIACENYAGFHKLSDLKQTECVEGWNFVNKSIHANDDQGHGSHVAGTIAQSTNNGIGTVGLAHHARLMPVKVLSGTGSGTNVDVADGIRWAAAHGAQVINLSLGGPGPCTSNDIMQKAVDFARSKGSVVVIAAGNNGGVIGSPGNCKDVVTVSAVDKNDKLAEFSSRGPEVDVAAPGVGILQQTICDSGKNGCEDFLSWNGTSMATPHVAAAAALLVGQGISSPEAVEEILKKTAKKVDSSKTGKLFYGEGIMQAGDAVKSVSLTQGFTRLAMLLVLTGILGSMLKKFKHVSPWTPEFMVPAFLTGVGLFFLPWIFSSSSLVAQLAMRPMVEYDLLFSAGIHVWMPLATALVPFGMTVLGFHNKQFRVATAGVGVGIATYLVTNLILGYCFAPLGAAAMIAWVVVNAVSCMFLAKSNLAE